MTKKLPEIIPGEILLEKFLQPMDISPNKLAKDIGVPPNRISQILHGKREITADTALRLGRYFNIEPEFWVNLQTRYNLKVAKNKGGAKIKREVKVYFSSEDLVSLSLA